MKYIDADKLIAEIDKILAKAEKDEKKALHKIDANGHLIAVTKTAICVSVKKIIASLQQEQPADGDDGKFVKISVRKEVAEQFQKLGDVILAGQSSFIRAMNQQEQSEQTCKTCGFYENNCPFIRGKLIPYPNKVCKDYIHSAMKEQEQPSIPSNLDEVAEEYTLDVKAKPFSGLVKNAFKAGAEWMAGQFQKIDGSLVDWYETNGVDYCHGISTNESFEVPEGFYIRKK